MLILLLIEDNPSDVILIHREFEMAYGSESVEFTDCARLADALALLDRKHFDLILLDLALQDSTHPETMARMFEVVAKANGTPIVVITGAAFKGDLAAGSLGLLTKGPNFIQRLINVTRVNDPLEAKLHKIRKLTGEIHAATIKSQT